MKKVEVMGNEEFDDNISFCINIPEAAKIMRVSRNHMYKMVREHQVPSIKLGRRRVISKLQLQKFLEQEKI
jgi:excisionase family DNA binding protein